MKKIIFKRILVFMMTVLLLSVSVGNAFICVNDISVSQAVVPAVLGYDVMYEMCRYIGSVYLGYTSTRETPEVNIHNDDVARVGYTVIKAMYEHGIFNPAIPLPDEFKPNVFTGVVDTFGQQYVFGSEAYKDIAETEFTVIQGGKNDGNDDDDDDDDDEKENNIIHFPKKVGDTVKLWFAMTATGAAAFADFISSDYQSWVNGEPNTILGEWLESFDDTFSDYESIQNVKGTYNISGYIRHLQVNGFLNEYYISHISDYRPFACFNFLGDGIIIYSYDGVSYNTLSVDCVRYRDGELRGNTSEYAFNITNGFYMLNIPVFANIESALAAFEADDYSDALNYAKQYRIADWLQDDWAGSLLDPLTGLNALSNWYNIVRHQGLNALGADATADDLGEYIRDYFANLGTDIFPEVDPSQAPIKYPSTVEDVVIDPASNPAVYPSSNPDPGTGTNPGTGTKPGTGTDPTPGGDSDPGTNPGGDSDLDTDVDMDENDYRVELRSLFPFCIPFDFVALLNVLDADPVAPRFEFPVVIPALDYREDVVLDLSIFDDVARVIRICEEVSFLVFLMFATSKVIRW